MSENLKIALAVVAGVVLLVGCAGTVLYFEQKAATTENRQEAQGIKNANHACLPDRPTSLDYNGSGWSNGPYWQVTCPDGSVQIVEAYPNE